MAKQKIARSRPKPKKPAAPAAKPRGTSLPEPAWVHGVIEELRGARFEVSGVMAFVCGLEVADKDCKGTLGALVALHRIEDAMSRVAGKIALRDVPNSIADRTVAS